MDKKIFRVIDSNCNRCAEGLRVLEDVARMILNNEMLSSQLKKIRHSIIENLSTISDRLINERDTDGDVGAALDSVITQNELTSIIRANAKRVEEGLRVMEEMAKLPDFSKVLDSNEFKHYRFEIYKLEQSLLSEIQRTNKARRIKGVYAILDTSVLKPKNIIDTAAQIINGGAGIIQLRDKSTSTGELVSIAIDLQQLCQQHDVLFIINDYLDIALAANTDGLHLGQYDLPVNIARKELPIDKIIGCSIQTKEQAQKAIADGADYIAIGSIFPTDTKEDITVVGLDLLKKLKSEFDIPLVAIGGIKLDNAGQVINSGADAVAVITAILNSNNVQQATRLLVQKTEL
jgi:thiamine-phosphate pyrophosphorylase